MTFNDIYPRWIAWKKRQVKESTLAAYKLAWIHRIRPHWGNVVIEDVRSRHLQDYVEKLLEEGKLSIKSIQDNVTLIKSILSWAWTYYELPQFSIKVVYPTESFDTSENKVKAFSNKDQDKLIQHIVENPSYANMGILLTLMTGMRIGEVCALKFSDIDFENHCIDISKTMSRLYVIDENTGEKFTKVVVGTPKSKSSRRQIPIYGFIEKWLKNASKVTKSEYYVVTGLSNPCEPRTYRNHYKKLINELGLENIKFHGLRHSFATRLITSNVDFKTVSEILGHSDIQMTLNIYSHPDAQQKRSGIQKAFKSIG